MFQALIGPVANLASTWFENKLEKTKADGKAKIAEAKARASVAEKVAKGEVSGKAKWQMLPMIVGKMSLLWLFY